MSEKVLLDPFKAKQKGKELNDEQRKATIKLSADYKQLFNSDAGRRVFRDLIDFCKVFETTMTGNSWSYFEEGKRAVGLHILHMREFGIEQELTLMRNETYKKSENERKA